MPVHNVYYYVGWTVRVRSLSIANKHTHSLTHSALYISTDKLVVTQVNSWHLKIPNDGRNSRKAVIWRPEARIVASTGRRSAYCSYCISCEHVCHMNTWNNSSAVERGSDNNIKSIHSFGVAAVDRCRLCAGREATAVNRRVDDSGRGRCTSQHADWTASSSAIRD